MQRSVLLEVSVTETDSLKQRSQVWSKFAQVGADIKFRQSAAKYSDINTLIEGVDFKVMRTPKTREVLVNDFRVVWESRNYVITNIIENDSSIIFTGVEDGKLD